MIKLEKSLPFLDFERAECVRINCINELYSLEALFWIQDGDRLYIAMLDGNMTIFNNSGNLEELSEFLKVLAPSSVFSDADTLNFLFGEDFNETNVYSIKPSAKEKQKGDEFSSGIIYKLFKEAGLTLPDYPHFAVDFCKRINRGRANCFYIKDCAAAFSVNSGEYAVINGIASNKKGMGSRCLTGILSKNCGKTVFAVCEDSLKPFYEKNGFCFKYKSGYWVKK
ncbi:MAG: hypothetical protein IJZ75_00645 [Clostridia bacterium]|nr:hypothetical protein [Clostridia bacterium]